MEDDTIWLNQSQILSLFDRDQSVISRHIKSVFAEGEKSMTRKLPHGTRNLAVKMAFGSKFYKKMQKYYLCIITLFYVCANVCADVEEINNK